MSINKNILIEELVEKYPSSVRYLMEQGIRCIVCGEAIWVTLEDAAKEKGFSDQEVEGFVKDLNELANREQGTNKKGMPNIDVKGITD
ncbi:MAG: DUF1858 domain-containing protein [Bacteroidetes bacterium]|nr:MAG: DUF1858 domain-containing protein [Bacteroidota bacterium]